MDAVAGAAEKLRNRILDMAATLLQADRDDLDVVDGQISRRGGGTTDLTLGAIAVAAMPGGPLYEGTTSLEAEFIYDSKGTLTFALSVHAAKLAVDNGTGDYRILDYYIFHDAGRMLNPMIVDGQMIGGAIDGMGCAMLSELLYNEAGQPLSVTLADYMIMSASEAPNIRLDHVQTIPTTNPLGVRGVGEGAVLPVAPAIISAITRIANEAQRQDLRHLNKVPLSPTAVLSSMREN